MSSSDSNNYRTAPSCAACPVRLLTVYSPPAFDAPAAIEALRSGVREFPARHTICHAGQATDEVFTVLRGWAFRFNAAPAGRQILSFLLPGDLIGLPLLSADKLSYSVQALTPVTLCAFSRAKLAEYIGAQPKLLQHLALTWSREAADSDERLADLGRRSAIERLARLILDVVDRLRQRGAVTGLSFAFPLRQKHIADALGLTTIHVNRVLGEMRRQGLLKTTGDGLTILDLPGLLRIAGMQASDIPGI